MKTGLNDKKFQKWFNDPHRAWYRLAVSLPWKDFDQDLYRSALMKAFHKRGYPRMGTSRKEASDRQSVSLAEHKTFGGLSEKQVLKRDLKRTQRRTLRIEAVKAELATQRRNLSIFDPARIAQFLSDMTKPIHPFAQRVYGWATSLVKRYRDMPTVGTRPASGSEVGQRPNSMRNQSMPTTEPQDVCPFAYPSEGEAQAAAEAITARIGPIAQRSGKLVIISAPGPTMEAAASIATQMGGKIKGPSLTWRMPVGLVISNVVG